MRYIFLILCSALLLISCKEDVKTKGKNYSFYHWNTNFKPTNKTNQLIKHGGTYKEYVRFFDLVVDKNVDKVYPVATVQFEEDTRFLATEIVPVIYIRNEVFLHEEGRDYNIQKLALNTADKIKRIQNKHLTGKVAIREIQIDCDWTDSTRNHFFSFLKSLKSQMPGYSISSTLRLHQVKYRERTGVPPVDKVVLMAYNVGDLGNVKETNSILSNDITAQYLEKLDEYPLPFDVALPLFEWGVLYRNGKLKGLLRELTPSMLGSAFAKAEKENSYTAKSDSYINGIFIYKGDHLRVETITKDKLEELSTMIKEAAPSYRDYQTIYYHINTSLTSEFSYDDLSSFAK